jgi:hypothetical protein
LPPLEQDQRRDTEKKIKRYFASVFAESVVNILMLRDENNLLSYY